MATKKKTKKVASKVSRTAGTKKVRQIKRQNYKSFRLSKRIANPHPKLPSSFKLFKMSIRQLLSSKKLFFGIVFAYLLLTALFVNGFGLDNNLPELKLSLEEIFTGKTGQFITGLTIFSFLVGSSGSATSDVAGVYQSILLIIVSLALIWALRQTHAKNKVSIRDAFYKGLYPLVPFIFVLIVIGLQLLPLFIGSTLYNVVVANGLAINLGEKAVWWLLLGLFALLSLYMVSSSMFALYIVTLPDMRPMQALRSARELVRHRRWAVMRKVFFLPFILIVLSVIVMVPLIIFATPIAEWTFFILTMLSLAVVHSYMYGFYRELLPHERQ